MSPVTIADQEAEVIIQQVDGTKSYICRSPLFAAQLALLHDGESGLFMPVEL